MNTRMPPILHESECPDYPVVHLKHLMISDPTNQSGIRLDYPVLRIDTGAWDVIVVIVCISCSIPHSLVFNTPYERSIFLILNYIKHVNIN